MDFIAGFFGCLIGTILGGTLVKREKFRSLPFRKESQEIFEPSKPKPTRQVTLRSDEVIAREEYEEEIKKRRETGENGPTDPIYGDNR